MTKFIFEIIFVEEVGNPLLNEIYLQDLVDAWPLVWISLEHKTQQVGYILAEVSGHIGVLAYNDLLSQLMQTLSIERWL